MCPAQFKLSVVGVAVGKTLGPKPTTTECMLRLFFSSHWLVGSRNTINIRLYMTSTNHKKNVQSEFNSIITAQSKLKSSISIKRNLKIRKFKNISRDLKTTWSRNFHCTHLFELLCFLGSHIADKYMIQEYRKFLHLFEMSWRVASSQIFWSV